METFDIINLFMHLVPIMAGLSLLLRISVIFAHCEKYYTQNIYAHGVFIYVDLNLVKVIESLCWKTKKKLVMLKM